MEIRFDFAEKILYSDRQASESLLKNIGYLYLQKIYNSLNVKQFFNDITKDAKISYAPDVINRFMVYSRILDPDSKLGSYNKLNKFYEQPDFDYQHILRTMDLIYEHSNEYITHLFKESEKIIKRNTSVCYYDCTNYYCEAESPDDDYVDKTTGEIFHGLRQYGFAKDHKPNPLVEMGLFMDTNGIPISMCIAPGNTNEQTTAIPLEKELIQMFDDEKKSFIYCADAGLGSYHIRNFNNMRGRAFVITQSIKKLSEILQKAVFEDYDYRLLSNNAKISIDTLKEMDITDENNLKMYNDKAYKILYTDTPYDVGLYDEISLANGKTKKVKSKAVLKQKVIITFSRKYMEYQRFIRNRQIERAKKLLTHMNVDEYKKGPNDISRFIKRVSSNKEQFELDEEKIKAEEKYDGYYAIATNLDDNVNDIIAINEQRYKIEECFRILKTDFSSRPYYHRLRERIISHFIICYTALLIYRIMEVKLNSFNTNIHLTTTNIIETLKNMNIANISDMCYASQYNGSLALTTLEGVFNLGLDKKYYLPKELNKICKKK